MKIDLTTKINARTHAVFLNHLFGKKMRGFRRCCWSYDKNTLVWFVRFDDKKREGYKNTIDEENGTLCQNNAEGRRTWAGAPIDDSRQVRLVFGVYGDGDKREYRFKGVYQYINETSDPYGKEYFRKIASEFSF